MGGPILLAVQGAAWEAGSLLLLSYTGRRADLEQAVIGALLEHQVEGLVFGRGRRKAGP
jgi:DNA-binding LacI/PurR family transcriptional regulator